MNKKDGEMGISLVQRNGNLFEREEEGEGSRGKELLIDQPSWEKNRKEKKKKKKEATVPVEGIANLKEEERPKERGIKLLIALLVVAVLLLKASIQYVCLPSSCGGLKPYCLGAACYHRLLEVTQPSCPQQSGAERIAAGSPLSFGH